MSKNNGGPAFPFFDPDDSGKGMSLRDYFASAAMSGYVFGWPLQKDAEVEHLPTIAKLSYKIADAMLTERDK